MCEWNMSLLVSLDIGTRVTNKYTTGFAVHFVDNGSVMWIICKSKGWWNKVINVCVFYPAQHMMYMNDLNKGCMQNKNVLKVFNYYNDTVFLTHVYLSALQSNKSFFLSIY